MKYMEINSIQNMMVNIITEGQHAVWQYIDQEKNALVRCEKRKLYWEALKKIKKGK